MPAETTKRIHVVCECGRAVDVPAMFAGKTIRCKKCGSALSVPGGAKKKKVEAPRPEVAGSTSPLNIAVGALLVLFGLLAAARAAVVVLTVEGWAGAAGPAVLGQVIGSFAAVVLFCGIGARTLAWGLREIHDPARPWRLFPPAQILIGGWLGLVGTAFFAILFVARHQAASIAVLIVAIAGGAFAVRGIRNLQEMKKSVATPEA